MSGSHAIDFAFDRIGRFINAGDPRAWTGGFGLAMVSKKKTRFGPGQGVLISERDVTFAGIEPLFAGEAPSIRTIASASDLKWTALFEPPKGKWICLLWDKVGVPLDGLYLNLFDREAVVGEKSGTRKVVSRPPVLRDAAAKVGGVAGAPLYAAHEAWAAKRRGAVMSERQRKVFEDAVVGTELGSAFALLEKHEQSIQLFQRYLAFTASKVKGE